jgi:hypothetical protein
MKKGVDGGKEIPVIRSEKDRGRTRRRERRI